MVLATNYKFGRGRQNHHHHQSIFNSPSSLLTDDKRSNIVIEGSHRFEPASQPAIAKFMEEKYSSLLPSNFKKMLSIQLKKFVKSEKLVKIKNSYEVFASENVKLVAAAAASIKESEKTYKAVVKNGEKTKRLSQVKTPEALKKKKKVSTPALKREFHHKPDPAIF
ncbi:hypothetical protein ACSBR1_025372 [Camellia fascicularis]